jgi:hypothetical protein
MSEPLYNTSVCPWFLSPEASWLPPTYALAAYCACTMNNTFPTSEVPSAQCVRAQVHLGHSGGSFFSSKQKVALRTMRAEHCNGTSCSLAYDRFLNDTNFVGDAVALHERAYHRCCCPGSPAPLVDWWLIVLFGAAFEVPFVCDATYLFMRALGPCGCQGW